MQSGTTLSQMTTAGVATTLSLPTGVVLSSARTPRFAVWDREVIMVNSPNTPLAITREGGVRQLAPSAPTSPPNIDGTGAGTLSGTYRVRVSFIVKDLFGNLVAESGLGPISAATTISSEFLLVSNIPISTDSVPTGFLLSRRVYRTTTSGSTYFPWIDVDGNTVTRVQSDMSDASLQLIAAPTDLGEPPNLMLVAEWKKRLWGVGRQDIDTLRYSGASAAYGWPLTNSFIVPPLGSDDRGVTALIRRRDELGVARRNALAKITATSSTFDIRTVVEGVGVESQDSVVVHMDVAYFLGHSFGQFGVYKWDSGGVTNISDGKVYDWLNTDTYFNQSRFQYSFGRYNPATNAYELHLAATGASTENRWISVDLETGEFWGPHQTAALTPTCAGQFQDSSDLPLVVVGGSNGFIYKLNQSTYADDTSAIDFDVDTTFFHGNAPDIQHFWGQPSLLSRIESTPTTLTITPKVGRLDATAGTAISADLTLGRERLRRLGVGAFAQLNLRLNTLNKGCRLFGLEIPWHEVGRR